MNAKELYDLITSYATEDESPVIRVRLPDGAMAEIVDVGWHAPSKCAVIYTEDTEDTA